jgi:hypothetical protein
MSDDGFEVIRDKDSHGPISIEYKDAMNRVAAVLDSAFNPTGKEGVVFTILLAKSGDMQGGRVN